MTTPSNTSAATLPERPRERSVFCNRTLNLRSIGAVGYDMDYTLIQYAMIEWEAVAYAFAKERLLGLGWPVERLEFDPDLMIQGLIIDTQLGNLLKVNRFGFVKTAFHGTRPLEFETQRERYVRTIVDHHEDRFVFLSTLFSVSEASLFAQLVELFDAGELPAVGSYVDLYGRVRRTLDEAHRQGHLKAAIAADFDRFVERDEQTCEALLDQRDAGKKLMLITNSDWSYTHAVMSHAFDAFLPDAMTWRDLFDFVIVSARKPDFFSSRSPLLEVVDDEGLLKSVSDPPAAGKIYFGGNASIVEDYLGLSGHEILFVGDHFFGDVHATKRAMRWRTALIVRELEEDLSADCRFAAKQHTLARMMRDKEELELAHCHVRLRLQRARAGRDEGAKAATKQLKRKQRELSVKLSALDEHIAPLARESAQLGNAHWGPLMRAGAEKSYLAHLVERHADIYTSRVSNFLYETPFAFFRSARGSLPHDPEVEGVSDRQ